MTSYPEEHCRVKQYYLQTHMVNTMDSIAAWNQGLHNSVITPSYFNLISVNYFFIFQSSTDTQNINDFIHTFLSRLSMYLYILIIHRPTVYIMHTYIKELEFTFSLQFITQKDILHYRKCGLNFVKLAWLQQKQFK